MIRHIIALIAVALAVWAVAFMAKLDIEANKFQRIAELIKSTSMEDKKIKVQQSIPQQTTTVQPATSGVNQKDKEVQEKLKALREKAGNIAAFKVSPLYKKSCASCHGAIGEGVIGPKLIGDSKEKVLNALHDFKSGKRKNYVMYGLLGNMSEEQLESLAEEISTFQAKLEAASK
ncbi:MAG: hypothetical protein B6D59_07435 [Campylobacteraceae bacterium 4484_4]|nr:MAG: hypothetical protein B6D59_07435 [Campylobacteraceae bacterium 4484_4]